MTQNLPKLPKELELQLSQSFDGLDSMSLRSEIDSMLVELKKYQLTPGLKGEIDRLTELRDNATEAGGITKTGK